jgi:hypothetical protein
MISRRQPSYAHAVGTVIAHEALENGLVDGGIRKMREVADGFMQLLAIIMVLITLAVSTAAFGQMLG